jgi:hypothetical protein
VIPRRIRLIVAAGRPLLRLLPPSFRQRYRAEISGLIESAVSEALARGGTPAAMREGIRQWSDVVATAIRQRLCAAADSVRGLTGVRAGALTAATAVMTVAGALLLLQRASVAPVDAYAELVVSAHDPAGHFSLTLRHGRLVAASLGGEPLPQERLRQEGGQLQLIRADGGIALAVHFEAPGMIRWEPRSP